MDERIRIRVTQDGAKAVRKDIEGLGAGADKASKALGGVKAAIAGVAAVALGKAVQETIRLADSYTELTNRIRVVTEGEREMIDPFAYLGMLLLSLVVGVLAALQLADAFHAGEEFALVIVAIVVFGVGTIGVLASTLLPAAAGFLDRNGVALDLVRALALLVPLVQWNTIVPEVLRARGDIARYNALLLAHALAGARRQGQCSRPRLEQRAAPGAARLDEELQRAGHPVLVARTGVELRADLGGIRERRQVLDA